MRKEWRSPCDAPRPTPFNPCEPTMAPGSGNPNNDHSGASLVRACTEIVGELVSAVRQGHDVNLNGLRARIARKHKMSTQPKLVDIIAAIPEEHRAMLLPRIRAKPIRTASGIAVVAVMCKPHRCPHIAMTGNICVYCLAEDHQILTDRGFMFVHEVEAAMTAQVPLEFASYDQTSGCLVYEAATRLIVKPAATQRMVEMTHVGEVSNWSTAVQSSDGGSSDGLVADASYTNGVEPEDSVFSNGVSLLVTPEHDMLVKHGRLEPITTSKADVKSRHQTPMIVNRDTHVHWKQHDYDKVQACTLLECDDFDVIQMRASAPNGILTACGSDLNYPFMDFAESLDVCTDERLTAFMHLYGFWHASRSWALRRRCTGSVTDAGISCDAVIFVSKNKQNVEWICAQLDTAGLKNGTDYIVTDQDTVHVSHPSWRHYFHQEQEHGELSGSGTKWMSEWVWKCNSMHALAVLEGMRRVDSGESDNVAVIDTSSAWFRDEIVRLALHAGRHGHFTTRYSQGNRIGTDGSGHAVIADHTLWRVSYSDCDDQTQPVLVQKRDVREVEYTGRTWCVTVPHGLIVARRAVVDASTGLVVKASKPVIVGNCPGGPDSDFEYSTQSYTGYEPTSMRAIRARYDPYEQARGRIDQLKSLGHNVDKVEYIIMGGTFMSLSESYRDKFIASLHDALSGHCSSNVDEAVRFSEQSQTRCIGITIETRPDYCLKPHLSQMLRYGCTRLEVGVQSVYEDVARDTNRGHTVRAVCETFQLAKDAGYKVVAHMMPDLPNVGMDRDLAQFREFFENPAFRADGLKIYPTLVIRGTGLYELWRTGRYKNYSPQALVDLVAKILAMVPPWTRVYRVQRDIPMPLVTSGVEYGNLRELAQARMKDLGVECRDVRTREVGIQDIHHKVRPDQVELLRRDYVANGGWETFLTYEDPQQDILVGLLRLRRCSDEHTFRPELVRSVVGGQCSIVRELHVYGSVVPMHSRDPTKFQHQGFGTLLMEEAERIARDEHGSVKIAVISGVGTRHYYRKLGYELDGPYMSKMLK